MEADRRPREDFYRAFLNGYGALFFAPSPAAGALFLLGTFAASPVVGSAVLVGLLAGTATAHAVRRPRAEIEAGLHGYNAALASLAVLVVVPAGDLTWIAIVLAAVVSTLLMALALSGPWVRRLNLPALSWPALLAAYPAILLLAQGGGRLVVPDAMLPAFLTRHDLFRPDFYGEEWFRIAGSITVDWPGKLLFALALLLHSRRLFLLSVAGVAAGMVVGFAFLGFMGAFNPTFVLLSAAPTFVALAGIFTAGGIRSWIFGLAGVAIAFLVWFHAGLVLADHDLPVLTLPLAITVTALLLLLRILAPRRLPFLPDALPLIRVASPESAAAWGRDRTAGWRYWRDLARKNGHAIADRTREGAIDRARDLLRGSRRVVALTGAGMSTESGIPDYRTGAVAWKTYDTSHFRFARFLASEESRRRYWEMSQDFYLVLRGARPNAGHLALADLDRTGRLAAIITQNVDRLHQQAGADPERVIEIHGHEHRVSCLNCGRGFSRDEVYRRILNGVAVPHCPACQGILKPDSIAFDQPMPEEPSRRALDAVRGADLLLVVGTSLTVEPVASLPLVALERGAGLLVVNLEPTDIDPFAAVVLRGPASRILPRLVAP